MDEEPRKVKCLKVINDKPTRIDTAWLHRDGLDVKAIGVELMDKGYHVIGSGDTPEVILEFDESDDECICIEFPEFGGWEIWSAEVVKSTLSVCMIRREEHC